MPHVRHLMHHTDETNYHSKLWISLWLMHSEVSSVHCESCGTQQRSKNTIGRWHSTFMALSLIQAVPSVYNLVKTSKLFFHLHLILPHLIQVFIVQLLYSGIIR